MVESSKSFYIRSPAPSSPTPLFPPMDVWQGVAMDFLMYHLGPPCPTLLRLTGGPPRFQGWPAHRAGGLRLSSTLFDTPPHAVRLYFPPPTSSRTKPRGWTMPTSGSWTTQSAQATPTWTTHLRWHGMSRLSPPTWSHSQSR
jgi:hypothetical protein